MRAILLAALAAVTIAAPAVAYDATKAPRYASPDMYRPNVDQIIINGPGSTGDVSGMSVTLPGGTTLTLPSAIGSKLDRDGPLTSMSEAEAPANLPVFATAPQVQWRGRQYTIRTAPAGGRPDYAYAGQAITLIDPGSGQNGPANAGYGLTLSAIKQGFPSQSSGVGELDTLLIVGRQAGPTPTTHEGASDYDGIQVNFQQAGDPGYAAGAEFHYTRIDPNTYAQTHSMTLQYGVMDPFGKNGEQGKDRYAGVNRLSWGYAAFAGQGVMDRGLYIANNGGTWDDFLYLGGTGNPFLRVKGADGALVFGNNPTSMTLRRQGSGTLTLTDNAGTTVQEWYQGGITSIPSLRASTVAANVVHYNPLDALPGNATEGDTAYLKSTHKLYVFDGTAWQPTY